MELPKGVHRVSSRGKVYFYYQEGRGTKAHAGARIKLPSDPSSPDFWQAIRQAQGMSAGPVSDTVRAVITAYKVSPQYQRLGEGSKDQYARGLRLADEAWGALPVEGIRPVHMRALMDGMADLPGKANTFLGVMRAFSSWCMSRDHCSHSMTEGVEPYAKTGGHKPWTPEQIACAHKHLRGNVRRFIFLGLYTGQRGSDLVRLGPSFIDEGGFSLLQQKTGREVWCPIVPELQLEMATWDRLPGPYVRQADGKVMTRKQAWKAWDDERQERPELKPLLTATPHGMRCTAVIRLRQEGMSTGQISDMIGMSLAMIERYCRFADKKASGKAALVKLNDARERAKNGKL